MFAVFGEDRQGGDIGLRPDPVAETRLNGGDTGRVPAQMISFGARIQTVELCSRSGLVGIRRTAKCGTVWHTSWMSHTSMAILLLACVAVSASTRYATRARRSVSATAVPPDFGYYRATRLQAFALRSAVVGSVFAGVSILLNLDDPFVAGCSVLVLCVGLSGFYRSKTAVLTD